MLRTTRGAPGKVNKTARDSAQAATEAALRAQDLERSEQQQGAEKQREREELEQAHAEFGRRAQEAGIAGALHLVAPSHRLDVDRLLLQGFIARRLQRRMSFEADLQSLLRQKDEVLSRLADRLVVECRGISIVGDDLLLHRNPLRLMMETLCGQPDGGLVGGEGRLHVALEQRAGRKSDQPTEIPQVGRCVAEQSLTCYAPASCIQIKGLRHHTKCVRPDFASFYAWRRAAMLVALADHRL